jgi:hypothetical protein
VLIAALNLLTPVVAGAAATDVAALLWCASLVATTLLLWRRERGLRRADAAVAGALAVVVALSRAASPRSNVATVALLGVWTFAGWLTSAAALRAVGRSFPWTGWEVPRRWWCSLLAAAGVGVPVAVLNAALYEQSGNGHLMPSPRWLLTAIQPGVQEEVGMRLVLMALAVYLVGGRPHSRGQGWLVVAVGILPHAAAHVLGVAGSGHVAEAVQFTVVTSVLYGLPLFWLQRRFGLVAASGAHWLIDAVRFTVTGGV